MYTCRLAISDDDVYDYIYTCSTCIWSCEWGGSDPLCKIQILVNYVIPV